MSADLSDGFSQENVERIYRGEPALVDGQLPVDVLSTERWEALSLNVGGLREGEIRQEMGVDKHDVRLSIALGLSDLGVVSRSQLAGFFPLDQEDPVLAGKNLADLPGGKARDMLQALTIGQPYQAASLEIGSPNLNYIRQVWSDIDARGAIALTQIANALRARSVQAIEARLGTIDGEYLREFTLPVVAAIEPAVGRLFIDNTAVTDFTQAES